MSVEPSERGILEGIHYVQVGSPTIFVGGFMSDPSYDCVQSEYAAHEYGYVRLEVHPEWLRFTFPKAEGEDDEC